MTHESNDTCVFIKDLSKDLKGSDHWNEVGIGKTIILNWRLKRVFLRFWSVFNCIKMQSSNEIF
jgi:hypothetical protein